MLIIILLGKNAKLNTSGFACSLHPTPENILKGFFLKFEEHNPQYQLKSTLKKKAFAEIGNEPLFSKGKVKRKSFKMFSEIILTHVLLTK